MSTENPAIANFDGLEAFEGLAGRLRLEVRTALATLPERLQPDDLIRLPAHDLRRIGLALTSDWAEGEVVGAISRARLDAEQVEVLITAEDGFLKERTKLSDPTPVTSFPPMVKLADYNADRVDALLNTHRGFAIGVHIVLCEDIEPMAFRPHRKGTILARAAFKVLPSRDTGGLDPKPLTEQQIADFELSKNTVLYVHSDTELLSLESLDGELEIYIHEQLLISASHQRGPDRDAVIGGLAIEALCQVVHMVSAELAAGGVAPEGDSSAIMRLLRNNLKAAGLQISPELLPDLLRDDPRRIAGLLSGLDNAPKGFFK